ncbi:hypothetical protein [Halomonas sp. LBP4]|uniref:hypothetical protein n=1 Tax=Halomonas sp. LBP4 TaxID=2044917 RepID=UPI000D76174F|nr:hypothetical protein [Halomonas sp. LBP4]PXX94680.1 hypothetical protein CR157_21490 [Halomonas sp. LBP4]
MTKGSVRDPAGALAYLCDCTLATVCTLACKKSAPKYETRRQIAMAQQAIDWMRLYGVDFSKTRAREVVEQYGGSVEAWAASFKDEGAAS